jgi:hypothetical protein
VLLTSADVGNTATVGAGGTLRLVSQRVCGWLPITATASDGTVVETYDGPCRGETWSIGD